MFCLTILIKEVRHMESDGKAVTNGEKVISEPSIFQDLVINGKCMITAPVTLKELTVNGSLQLESELKAQKITIAGKLMAKGKVEADEFSIAGKAQMIGDLISKEKLDVNGDLTCLGTIQTDSLMVFGTVKATTVKASYVDINWESKKHLFGRRPISFIENIECQTIKAQSLQCPNVKGKDIYLKEYSKIGNLTYSGTLDIDKSTQIAKKVNEKSETTL